MLLKQSYPLTKKAMLLTIEKRKNCKEVLKDANIRIFLRDLRTVRSSAKNHRIAPNTMPNL